MRSPGATDARKKIGSLGEQSGKSLSLVEFELITSGKDHHNSYPELEFITHLSAGSGEYKLYITCLL